MYVLALALVVVAVATSFLSNVGNEARVSAAKQARFTLLHAAEAAAEIGRGRMQVAPLRENWDGLVNTGVPVFAGDINGVVTNVYAENIPGSPYDAYLNSRVRLRADAVVGDRTVTVYKSIRTPDASEYAAYVGAGGDAAQLRSGLVTFFAGQMLGKVFFDYWHYDMVDNGGVPTFFAAEVTSSGTITNSTGRADSDVFRGGQPRANLPPDQQPSFSFNATSGIEATATAQNLVFTASPSPVRIRLRADSTFSVSTDNGLNYTSRPAPAGTVVWVNGDFTVEGDPGQGGAAFRRFAGRMTVGGSNDGLICGDIFYQDTASDLLGIVARRHLMIQTDANPATFAIEAPYVSNIDAVTMAERGVFVVNRQISGPGLTPDPRWPSFRLFGGTTAQCLDAATIIGTNGLPRTGVVTRELSSAYVTWQIDFDAKTRNAPPPAFPRLMGVNPSVLPGSFDVVYE